MSITLVERFKSENAPLMFGQTSADGIGGCKFDLKIRV